MRIESFEGWARLNEEAQAEQMTKAIEMAKDMQMKSQALANDESKMSKVLSCIEGKSELIKGLGLVGVDLASAVIWGLTIYGSTQTGGLAWPALSTASGVLTGWLTNQAQKAVNSKEFEREFKKCKDCLSEVVKG